MMLAGAEAIAARAQFPGKGGNIVSWKIVKSRLFETDIYCMHTIWKLWPFVTTLKM